MTWHPKIFPETSSKQFHYLYSYLKIWSNAISAQSHFQFPPKSYKQINIHFSVKKKKLEKKIFINYKENYSNFHIIIPHRKNNLFFRFFCMKIVSLFVVLGGQIDKETTQVKSFALKSTVGVLNEALLIGIMNFSVFLVNLKLDYHYARSTLILS